MKSRFSALLVALLALGSAVPTLHAATRPNVLLVTMSGARADRMGFLGARKPLTPNLDRLAKTALVFERAYAQSPETTASIATILSGTYPQGHQVDAPGVPLAPSTPYLPDLLHAAGYRTAAFVGSSSLDPRSGLAPGFARGFDLYDAGASPSQETPYPLAERSAVQLTTATLGWIKQARAPWFVWVHLAAPAGRYDAGITANDAALGRLLTALRTANAFDNTAIVITADHGAALGDHGETQNGVFLYEETIRVPLLVKPAGKAAAARVSSRVQLVDVAPTLLALAGAPVLPAMEGDSLLRSAKSNADRPAYARAPAASRELGWSALDSWRAGKYLLIRAPKSELYDLTADPGASRDLAGSSKAVLDTLSSQLEAFLRHFRETGGGAQLSSSEMQKLASLGYVGLQRSAGPTVAATGVDPKSRIATANDLAAAYAALADGRAAQAVAAFRRLAEQEPKAYGPRYGLGMALLQQRSYAPAAEAFHKAIEAQPGSALAHYGMGIALGQTGDWKTAVTHLEIAAPRLSEMPAAHARLSEAYANLGRKAESERERAKAAALAGR